MCEIVSFWFYFALEFSVSMFFFQIIVMFFSRKVTYKSNDILQCILKLTVVRHNWEIIADELIKWSICKWSVSRKCGNGPKNVNEFAMWIECVINKISFKRLDHSHKSKIVRKIPEKHWLNAKWRHFTFSFHNIKQSQCWKKVHTFYFKFVNSQRKKMWKYTQMFIIVPFYGQ